MALLLLALAFTLALELVLVLEDQLHEVKLLVLLELPQFVPEVTLCSTVPWVGVVVM